MHCSEQQAAWLLEEELHTVLAAVGTEAESYRNEFPVSKLLHWDVALVEAQDLWSLTFLILFREKFWLWELAREMQVSRDPTWELGTRLQRMHPAAAIDG